MRVGILTGGGDCPGLNAVIRAVVRKGVKVYGDEFVGFTNGWRGVMDGSTVVLDIAACRGILPRGGTILGTSRTNPYREDGGVERIRAVLAAEEVEALVAVGGEDTLGVAHRLGQDGLALVGVPKTIDNDLSGTEVTFGFHTAVQIACDAIDRLHTTAESHDRVMVVEVMGRHAGWIATYAGIAGGAAEILIPEEPYDLDGVCERLVQRHRAGRYASIVVVAEGAVSAPAAGEGHAVTKSAQTDAFGHEVLGGVGQSVADGIAARTGFETRVTTLGHIQRGGTPTAYDRILATRFGIAAIDAVHDGRFGHMVALDANAIVTVALGEAVSVLKTVDPGTYHDVARTFFG